MGAIRSEEEGMCKWKSVSGLWESSPKVRKESMRKQMNNVSIINGSKNSTSEKEFIMSGQEVAAEWWEWVLGLEMVQRSDKDLDIKGQGALTSHQ